MTVRHLPEAARQFIRFCLVGLLNTAVTYFSFLLLFKCLRVPLYASNAISYVLGLINSFFFNKKWTFGSAGFKAKELALFIAVFLVSYGIQFAFFAFMHHLHWREEIAQLLGMVVYTGIGFVGNKFFTFKEGPQHD